MKRTEHLFVIPSHEDMNEKIFCEIEAVTCVQCTSASFSAEKF